MPLLTAFVMAAGLVLVVCGLMLCGLWVGSEESRWRGTPTKTRPLRLDAHGHLLRAALMMLGVGGVLMAVPLWALLTSTNPPRPSLPIERQVSLRAERTTRGEERAGQTERQDRLGSVAFDIAGEWTISNTIMDTQYTAYRDLQLGFRLWIRQQGNTFEGRGEKYLENGQPIPPRARRPITIQGTLQEGGIIEATFQEAGLRRHTSGRFQLARHAPHELRGTFSSTAAAHGAPRSGPGNHKGHPQPE